MNEDLLYKRLFIWVEGEDDVRFFNGIIKPLFEKKYNLVEVRQYRRLKKEKFINFLFSIKSMNANYIYVRDFNNAPCITAKKKGIEDELKIDRDNIIIVVKEIESWYLAGLSTTFSKKFNITYFVRTDDISKQQFNASFHKNFDSQIDFMLEILKCFSIETAKQKNKSFKYFIDKHDCEVFE